MSGFTDSWLALREPADQRARNLALVQEVRRYYEALPSLRIMDLGAGTGSNLRFMAPLLGHGQQWLLLDHDASLLARAPDRIQAWAQANAATATPTETGCVLSAEHFSARVECQTIDLAREMPSLPFEQTNLVTGAALLDLVSSQWLGELAGLCAQHQCAALFSLTFDGSIRWQPRLPLDSQVNLLLNRHQRQDKGFGMALGSSAVTDFHRVFGGSGFRLLQRYSPWTIGADQRELHQALLTGWTEAVSEPLIGLAASQREQIERWSGERAGLTTDSASRLLVGHADQLALPGYQSQVAT